MKNSGKRDRATAPAGAFDAKGNKASRDGRSPALDRAIQAQIGNKLRALYGELEEQPLPDRLTSILAKIGTATAGRENGS